MFDSGHKKPDKRKKVKGGDAEEIDNFLGPWAKYVDEKSVAKPTEVNEKYERSLCPPDRGSQYLSLCVIV